jgi:colanic acid/amylovoran biosynthesis glycosyltransferase
MKNDVTKIAYLANQYPKVSHSFIRREIHGAEKVQRSSFVATLSLFSRSQLYRWCDQSQWDKIDVVPCGVDRSFFTETTPISSDPRHIYVRRLCKAKGQLLLVEAIKLIVAAGTAIKLVLVEDGLLRPQIEALIATAAIKTAIELPAEVLAQMGQTGTERVAQQHDVVIEAQNLPIFLEDVTAKPAVEAGLTETSNLVVPLVQSSQ